MKFSTLAALMLSVAASALVASGGAAFTSKDARKVISETASPAERSDLITTAAAGFTRVGEGEVAILIATESPPLTQAQVLLNVIDALPVSRRTEVDALMLKVDVAHALTTDWHHTRISRWAVSNWPKKSPKGSPMPKTAHSLNFRWCARWWLRAN